jgi:spore coat protein H
MPRKKPTNRLGALIASLLIVATAAGIAQLAMAQAPKLAVANTPVAPLSATPTSPLEEREMAKQDKHHKAIDAFYSNHVIPSLTFELQADEWENLKKDARRYAEVTMTEEGGKVYKNLAVKLKGAAGSFQGPDGKPGLTIDTNKFKGGDRFYGQKKFHLNNCAQDGTALIEMISGEIARKCGVPASRCSHAFVKWQGRDLGLYVVKEGFTKEFLGKFFKDVDGDLYDGGFVREIDESSEKDQGDPKNVDNIKQLMAACREQDPVKRLAALDKILHIEAYITFTALESIFAHWDGYNFNRNNYRFYQDPKNGKFVFFLHGMDQTFGDPNAPAVRDSGSTVGSAVFSLPGMRQKYADRVRLIYDQVLKPIDWPARVTEAGNEVKAALAKKNPQWAKDFDGRINDARSRIEQRIAVLGKQLGDMPRPLAFSPQGIAKIESRGWRIEGSAAQIDEAQLDGRPVFRIRADGNTSASWRKNLALEPGKYRLEARIRTNGLQAAQDQSGEGAGLRISGGTRAGQNALAGDTPWKNVAFQFDAPGGDVVLVAELRAVKGEAWFDKESFQLVRVQ